LIHFYKRYKMGHATNAVMYPISDWLEENSKFFLPPVCNKMMHDTQLKVFFVGGPNQRKDFHLEEGEELFYMRKGNMQLPILERGKIKTVNIRQGDVFLLPGRIPHSPQREANTVGLVIERERLQSETDGLRYFVGETTDILFERWFHCDDLGSQLKPIIDAFFASDEYKTGLPKEDSVEKNPPWNPDSSRDTETPFNLQDWIDTNRRKIRSSGEVYLFNPDKYQSDIRVIGFGQGGQTITAESEMFLWQIEASSKIEINDEETRLKRDSTMLIPGGTTFEYIPTIDSITLTCMMNPNNKKRPA